VAILEFSDEHELLAKSGLMFIRELRADSKRDDAPDGVREDWALIARWLPHSTGELSNQSISKLERAWASYLAIGLAPSHSLQSAFDHFSKQIRASKADCAPTEIMNVFDRLLATDSQIAAKRASDIEAERATIAPIFAELRNPKQRPNSWRKQSLQTRQWIFFSGLWFAGTYFYAFLFDPFDEGGWNYIESEQFTQLFVIAILPILAGLVIKIYRRWVE